MRSMYVSFFFIILSTVWTTKSVIFDSTCSVLSVLGVNATSEAQKMLYVSGAKYGTFDSPGCRFLNKNLVVGKLGENLNSLFFNTHFDKLFYKEPKAASENRD